MEGGDLPDFLTKAERSARMSRIRGTNTGPERDMFRMLRREGVYFARHARGLPGSPDILFRTCRLAVFIDGDFWHGRNLDLWRAGLTKFWREKIEANVRRDQRNRKRLRALGWHVIRIWGKDVAMDPQACVRRVLSKRSRCLHRANGKSLASRTYMST